jgi:predicted ATPase
MDDDRFRFRHVLLRDAAYASASKVDRADLHERLADWLAEQPPGSAEPDEIVGYHLEQAYRYHAELAPETDRARAMGRRAADVLASAGRHALTRADVGAAANLLQRAQGLYDLGEYAVELDLDLAEALYGNGRLDEAKRVLEGASERARRAGDRGGELSVMLVRANQEFATSPEGVAKRVELLADEAVELFETRRDDRGLARAWFARAFPSHMRCQYGRRNAAFERAHAYATRAGDAVRARSIETLLATGHLYGPTPVAQALVWLDENHRLDREPIAIGVRAVLEAMAGRIDHARQLCRAAADRSRELGARYERGSLYGDFHVELLDGNAAAAAEHARASCAVLEEMGERNVLSTQAGQLAQALCALGSYDEADEWAARAQSLGAADDVMTQMVWRQARARILAHLGDVEGGLYLAREAVALGEQTDALNGHADALIDLSQILALGGQFDPAMSAARQAVDLYRRKGNTVMADRARALHSAHP